MSIKVLSLEELKEARRASSELAKTMTTEQLNAQINQHLMNATQPTDSQNEEPAEWPDIIGAGMGLGKETHMKEPQPAGSVEELAKKLVTSFMTVVDFEDSNPEHIKQELGRLVLEHIQSFAASQQQAREELKDKAELWKIAHDTSVENYKALLEVEHKARLAAEAAVKTLRGATERVLASFGDEAYQRHDVEGMCLDFVGTGSMRDGDKSERKFVKTVIEPCREALTSTKEFAS